MLGIGEDKIRLLGVKAVKKVGQLGAVCGVGFHIPMPVDCRSALLPAEPPLRCDPGTEWATVLPPRWPSGPKLLYLPPGGSEVVRCCACLKCHSPSAPQNDSVKMLLNRFARNTVWVQQHAIH